MVPIYAVDAWFALRFRDAREYLDPLRECYEAYVSRSPPHGLLGLGLLTRASLGRLGLGHHVLGVSPGTGARARASAAWARARAWLVVGLGSGYGGSVKSAGVGLLAGVRLGLGHHIGCLGWRPRIREPEPGKDAVRVRALVWTRAARYEVTCMSPELLGHRSSVELGAGPRA